MTPGAASEEPPSCGGQAEERLRNWIGMDHPSTGGPAPVEDTSVCLGSSPACKGGMHTAASVWRSCTGRPRPSVKAQVRLLGESISRTVGRPKALSGRRTVPDRNPEKPSSCFCKRPEGKRKSGRERQLPRGSRIAEWVFLSLATTFDEPSGPSFFGILVPHFSRGEQFQS